MKPEIIDFIVVAIANLSNLLIVGIMFSRPKRWAKVEQYLGLFNISLCIPLVVAVVFYIANGHEWWKSVLPGLLIVFLIFELLLDYIYKFDFRQTQWLGFYLLLFYTSQWGMIGFSFGLKQVYGFVTLGTYFLSLGATAYSYKKVGHGETHPEV